MSKQPLVSIVMGSDSDLEIMREAGKALEEFGIAYEIDVTSAHRSPDRTADFARKAAGRGIRVIIAGGGGAWMEPGIRFADLLAYKADESNHWKRWFAEHPAALDLPCDVAGAGTVRKLVRHIFVAELSFANRVHGLPRIDFEKLPTGTL